jgi:hypothetical protein
MRMPDAAATREETAPSTPCTRGIVSGTGGGPEKTILELAALPRRHALARVGAVPARAGDPGIEICVRARGGAALPFFTLPDRCRSTRARCAAARELCRAPDVRIWHGHDYKSNLFGILLRALRPAPRHDRARLGQAHAPHAALLRVDRWTLQALRARSCRVAGPPDAARASACRRAL